MSQKKKQGYIFSYTDNHIKSIQSYKKYFKTHLLSSGIYIISANNIVNNMNIVYFHL